jgi:regulator of sigma E protease
VLESFLFSIVGFLIAIAILVTVHEFGHYWVAKKLGVKVLRFSVGFGKPLYTKVATQDQTEYVLASIPLGGYVKMLDEREGDVSADERHRAFNVQPIWKRSLIVIAGPGINFLFAILVFFALGNFTQSGLVPELGNVPADSIAAQQGLQAGDRIISVDGKPVSFYGQRDLYIYNQVLKRENFDVEIERAGQAPFTKEFDVSDVSIYRLGPNVMVRQLGLSPVAPNVTSVISGVVAGSPASNAGLLSGDEIISIDGVAVSDWAKLVEIVSSSADQNLALGVKRGDVLVELAVTPEAFDAGGQTIGRIGIRPTIEPYPEYLQTQVDRTVGEAIIYGFEQTWLMTSVTVRMLGKMITREASHENISGPITIAQVSGDAIQVSFSYYLNILAVISISLGVMNLLPIPMLDGGHLLAYVVEAVAGQRASEQFYAVGQRVGIFLLLCLMTLAFYNDIFRLLN